MSHIDVTTSQGREPQRHCQADFDWASVIGEAFKKLSPRVQPKNPVMFVVYLGSIVTTLLWIQALGEGRSSCRLPIFAVAAWLWFTVLFANAAEALAEGRGKAQADALSRDPPTGDCPSS